MVLLNQAWALGKDLYALRAKLPVVNKSKAWVNVARVGEWKGHGQGEFQIDTEALVSFKRNFDEQVNPMMVSWEHGYVPGKPRDAAGWILDMELRANGSELWALVDFVDDAAERIKAKKYLFCSIVFRMNDTHRASGESIGPTMHELGLTNTPFIDGLQPMQLSRAIALAQENNKMKDTDIIKAALKDLGPDASIDQVLMWVKAEKGKDAARSGEPVGEAAPVEAEAESTEEEAKAASRRDKRAIKLAFDEAGAEVAGEEPANGEAEAAAIVAAVQSLADAAGVDVPTLLATIEEKQESLVAMLAGTASDDGGAAEAEATIANSRAFALSARVETLETELSTMRTNALRNQIELSIERGELPDEPEKLLDAAAKIGIDRLKELTALSVKDVPAGRVYASQTNSAVRKAKDGKIELSSLAPETQQVVGWLMRDGKNQQDAIALALADKENN